jgi:hypothetical protein
MFTLNTILACSIDIYHEQGHMIITKLLLPLGHISNNMIVEEKRDESLYDQGWEFQGELIDTEPGMSDKLVDFLHVHDAM